MALKRSLRKSLRSVGRKRKRETERTEGNRYERQTEKEIKMTEGMVSEKVTARVEKIFVNTKDGPNGTRDGEIEKGENTHTKMSSSNSDLRRQGNRQRANFDSVWPETAKFLFEFSSARFAGKARDKKDVLGYVVCLNWHRHRRRRKREKVKEEEGGNYFREVEIIFDRLGN